MAGTIGLSMTQQLDEFGVPLAGGRLYFIQAGTPAAPQNAFQDSALTLPWPNPFILDASGRIDQLFFADGSIKIRLTDVNGVEKLVRDGLLVVGASSGGGGGSPVDATTVLATGDIKTRYGTGVLSGFVRCNARTIGSATSGASERANADTQSLFGYLWDTDPNLTVSTGRGANSAADWAANKNIALPDFRSRALAGLGDMGNADNALFSGVTFTSGNSTTLGSLLGAARRTLTLPQLPTGITSSGTATGISNGGQAIPVSTGGEADVPATLSGSATHLPRANGWNFSTSLSGVANVTSNNTSGSAFDSVSTYGLVTIYIHL